MGKAGKRFACPTLFDLHVSRAGRAIQSVQESLARFSPKGSLLTAVLENFTERLLYELRLLLKINLII